jgi:hypothetical protein
MNFDAISKEHLLRRIEKASDTYRHYVEERRVLMDLTGLVDSNKDSRDMFDAFVADNGITVPKRNSGHNGGRPKKKVEEPEVIDQTASEQEHEYKPLPDASEAMEEEVDTMGQEVDTASETAAECEKVAEPAAKEPKSVTLDKAAVMAAYQLLAKNSQKIIDETEGKIAMMRNTIDNLLETVEQEIDKMQQYERILEELEDAETAVFE